MRKIIVHEFISLDGAIQAPGGADEDTDNGFRQGGWTMPYGCNSEKMTLMPPEASWQKYQKEIDGQNS